MIPRLAQITENKVSFSQFSFLHTIIMPIPNCKPHVGIDTEETEQIFGNAVSVTLVTSIGQFSSLYIYTLYSFDLHRHSKKLVLHLMLGYRGTAAIKQIYEIIIKVR